MKLVNNRFRIVKAIEKFNYCSSYLVCDEDKNGKLKIMNVIEENHYTKKKISELKHNFENFSNIHTKYICKVYDFGIISSINNEKSLKNIYYYTAEYIENKKDLIDEIDKVSEEEFLDLYVDILKGINYLHLKGYVYKYLDLTSLKIKEIRDKKKAYIEEPIKNEFKVFNQTNIRESILYIDNIYSLGIIGIQLIFKDKIDFNNIHNYKRQCINLNEKSLIFSKDFTKKILKICWSMISGNTVGVKSINGIIQTFNKEFNKKYSKFEFNELERLNFNPSFIGKTGELNEVIDNVKNNKGIIEIKGTLGIGKTSFIKKIEEKLKYEKYEVCSLYYEEDFIKKGYEDLSQFLKNIINISDKEIINRYKKDLGSVVQEFSKDRIDMTKILNAKQKILSRLSNFLFEVINTKNVVFLIDNICYCSKLFLEFVQYNFKAYKKSLDKKNLSFIISYSNKEFKENYQFRDFICKISKIERRKLITLNGLNKQEIHMYVKNIFNSNKINIEEVECFKDQTCGNPKIILEIIKDCYIKNIFYINENGHWKLDKKKFKKYEVSSEVQKILLNQLKGLSKNELEVLKYIAIFNQNEIKNEVIKYVKYIIGGNVETVLKGFISKGILQVTDKNGLKTGSFVNKILKSIIYNQMSEEEKKEKHNNIVKYIEINYKTKYKNLDQLIYHLEKSHQFNKVIKYSCILANNYKNKYDLENEKFYIKKALDNLDIINGSKSRIYTLSKNMGYILFIQNDLSKALLYYKRCLNLAIEMNSNNKKIDILNLMIFIFIEKEDLNKVSIFMNVVKNMLSKTVYKKGYIKYKQIQSTVNLKRGKLDKSQKIAHAMLPLCSGKYEKYSGKFYFILGNIEYGNGNLQKAYDNYVISRKIFEKYKQSQNLAKVLNNLSIIEIYFNHNLKSCESLLKKCLKIHQITGGYQEQLYPLYNLVNLYIKISKIKKAKEYALLILSESEKYKSQKECIIAYSLLFNINSEIYNFKEAQKYYQLSYKFIINGNYPEIIKNDFYVRSMNYFFNLKCTEHIQRFTEFILNSSKQLSETDKVEIFLINQISRFIKNYFTSNDKKLQDEAFIKLLKRIKSCKDILEKRKFLVNLGIIVVKSKLFINKVYEELKTTEQGDFKYTHLSKKYFITSFCEERQRLKYLKLALQEAQNEVNHLMMSKIYIEIGNYYKNKDFYNSINNYFYAYKQIRYILKNMDLIYRDKFIEYNNLIECIEGISLIESKFNTQKNIKFEQKSRLSWQDNYLDYNYLEEIFNNRAFKEYYKIEHAKFIGTKIEDINEVIGKIAEDSKINLDNILKYLTWTSLGTFGAIVKCEKNKFEILMSTNNKLDLPNSLINVICKNCDKPMIVDDTYIQNIQPNNLFLDLQKSFCMPLYNKAIGNKDNVKTYLYIETDRIIDDINKDNAYRCIKMKKILNYVVKNYILELNSNIDKLTKTLNRSAMELRLANVLNEAALRKEEVSIIMVDIDNFKSINDEFGHLIGDKVLKEVCNIIFSQITPNQYVGRYGGEEFLIILPKCTCDQAFKLSEKIRKKIYNDRYINNNIRVSISAGISSYPSQGIELWHLINKADMALYKAKKTGKNKSIIWDESFKDEEKNNNKLIWSIKNNEVKEYENINFMLRCIELLNKKQDKKEKLTIILNDLLNIMRGQYIVIYEVNADHSYSEEMSVIKDKKNVSKFVSKKLMNEVVNNKKGIVTINWEKSQYKSYIGNRVDAYSSIICPLIKNEEVIGLLYLKVSIKVQEFTTKEYNFVNIIANILCNLY
ncbi:hypothetical protein C3495_10795 [Clostridiaceae bacterium 14S0207]|nr:hypothetical protein C3495_10795 [Clostridiaceae bacterium 14S0207]